ncbi:MAG: 30S ribosomal protein S13 [Planctomycetes bacterium DG_23]|nr:MAG: 30S ribosomal protein S13 [Planctomycetes bacterium DG_23]
MPRIIGVDIPANKPAEIALTYIYGIGRSSASKILAEAGVDSVVRAKDLSEEELSRIASVIDKNFSVEGALRRQVSQNIARLQDIGCYRGLRHRKGLPVRGQRTRTNARTRKGKRKTVAVKKGVKERRG